jgi:hypothetical protein
MGVSGQRHALAALYSIISISRSLESFLAYLRCVFFQIFIFGTSLIFLWNTTHFEVLEQHERRLSTTKMVSLNFFKNLLTAIGLRVTGCLPG